MGCGKKGVSSIAAFVLLFFSLVIIVGVIVTLLNFSIKNSSIIAEEQERKINIEKTSIQILNVSFNNNTNPDETTIYITNDGENKVLPSEIDVYIDDVRFPRNNNNRTYSFESSNGLNPVHFDSSEILKFTMYLDCENGTHVVTATSEFGATDTIQFTFFGTH